MHIVAIVLQAVLGLLFLMAGFMKMGGAKFQVEAFDHYGYPQWFRVITGLIEFLGAIGMFFGIWYPLVASLAGIVLGITMIGAIVTHARVKDQGKMMVAPLVLFLLNVLVVIFQWHALVG